MTSQLPVAFVYNTVSWNPDTGQPVPGGMAERICQPIIAHLETPHVLTPQPLHGHVNVYLSHRIQYREQITASSERSVFLSHGVADKGWRNKIGQHYDVIAVSGPAWSIRMASYHCPREKIAEVGYAKLDPLFDGVREPAPDPRIRVMWAPTHGGGGLKFSFSKTPPNSDAAKRSSWWEREPIMKRLHPDHFNVTEAPHPRHKPDHTATFDEYRRADVVIADGGSTIYEAWALGLPVVFPSWLTAQVHHQIRGTFEHDIYTQRIGRHADSPAHLAELVREAAEQGITEAEEDFIEPIFPRSYRGDSGRRHAEMLDEVAATGRHTVHPPSYTEVVYRHRAGRETTVAVGSKQQREFEKSKWWTAVQAVAAH